MKQDISFLIATVIFASVLVLAGMIPVSAVNMLTDETSVTPSATTSDSNTLVASESAADTASPPADMKKLRDRLASVVAQLRKKDEQAIAGELKSVEGSTLEMDTIVGTIEKISLDEVLTKYYRIAGVAKEELKKTDLKAGQYAIVTGLKTDGTFAANEVYLDDPYEAKAGRVTEVNSTNYSFRLETFDKETITVNIDRSVIQESLVVNTGGLTGSGFTQIKEGDTAHIVYRLKSIKQPVTNITPARLLIIPAGYFSK